MKSKSKFCQTLLLDVDFGIQLWARLDGLIWPTIHQLIITDIDEGYLHYDPRHNLKNKRIDRNISIYIKNSAKG